MDFRFSEAQDLIADTVRKLFADTCGAGVLRGMLDSGLHRDESRWNALIETGMTGALIPESAGGTGLSEVDFVRIAEEAGYAALPEPLVESAGIATPLLAAAAPDHELLGNPSVSLAVGHPANPLVADADVAVGLLLHRDESVYLVEPDAVRLTRRESIDPFRRLFEVEWREGTLLSADKRLWDDALDRGALFAAAQCVGLGQRAVHIAVEYAKERKQFGKPIGSYQAVKHLLATAQVNLEFARPVVYAAAAQFPQRDAYSRARISHAKLVAAEASDLATRTALQVHGAMGYSWEVDVHFLLKRSLALREAWGSPALHRDRIAERIFKFLTGPEHTFAQGGQDG